MPTRPVAIEETSSPEETRFRDEAPVGSSWQVLKELALDRRSIRRYLPRPVSRQTLAEIIDIARHAPSNHNRQPWRFFVANDPEWVGMIVDLVIHRLAAAERRCPPEASGERAFLHHTRKWLYPLEGCPALVLVFYKPMPRHVDDAISTVLEAGDTALWSPSLISLGAAIQNLLLAAHARGLGACAHSGPVGVLRGSINRLLELPPRLELACLVTLGYPAEAPETPGRKAGDQVCRFLEGPLPEKARLEVEGGNTPTGPGGS